MLKKITYMKGIEMKVVRQCWCGKCSSLELDEQEYRLYRKWRAGELYIQELPLNACEREFLKTGMCRKCQKQIFNNDRTDRIKSARHNEVGVWA